ncbi:TPA: glycosyltransferase [Raoultella ornithinolytica]
MIAWVSYQRRADIMKDFWAYEDFYITSRFKSKYLKPLDYTLKIFLTIRVLIKYNPDVLWLQLPPTFLVFIGLVYKKIKKDKPYVIGDFHNSALRPKWFHFPLVRTSLNKIDALIAHNEQVRYELIQKKISSSIIIVLEDMPFSYSSSDAKVEKNTVLFPCSFDIDEPLDVVIQAAKKIPHIKFNITGNFAGKVSQDIIDASPANVNFTGYLSKEAFDMLFFESDVILGLTTRDNVQLSVSNEALSADKPMVLSNTTTLKDLFGDAAVFVDSLNAQSIAEGCSFAVDNVDELQTKTMRLKELRIERWEKQASILKHKISKSR